MTTHNKDFGISSLLLKICKWAMDKSLGKTAQGKTRNKIKHTVANAKMEKSLLTKYICAAGLSIFKMSCKG